MNSYSLIRKLQFKPIQSTNTIFLPLANLSSIEMSEKDKIMYFDGRPQIS